jgi:hypothetical protein
LIDIENKDILQICVTIIAGALVFITLVSLTSVGHERDVFPVASVVFGMAIIIIFSLAARVAIAEKKAMALNIINYGFGFLIGIAVFIVIINFLLR